MTESKIALDRYKKAKDEVERNISILLSNKEKIKDETEYALIHLKEHLNWYRSEVNNIKSSYRNKSITERILNAFPDADRHLISKYLSRHMVLTIGQFIILSFVVTFIISFWLMSLFERSDIVDCIMCGLLFGLGFTYIFALMYDCGSFIRLYFIKDITKEKSKNES